MEQIERLRRVAGSTVIDGFFKGIARTTAALPQSRPSAHGLRRMRDIRYRSGESSAHLLDVYRPDDDRTGLPVCIYLHGGGFRILSKDTHWMMGLAFARQGYVVFNVDYRKAPECFPAAHEDACEAYQWVIENAEAFGGDPSRIVLAGESAGANLTTALVVASCYERPEPYARKVFETGVVPLAAVPACGILQVSDPHRFMRRRKLPAWLFDRIEEVSEAYLGPQYIADDPAYAFADPLVMLETAEAPLRPLPPFFIPVGTKDPVLDDSRRLGAALERHACRADVRYYPGEVHAFHAFLWRRNARDCWAHTFEFLDDIVPA